MHDNIKMKEGSTHQGLITELTLSRIQCLLMCQTNCQCIFATLDDKLKCSLYKQNAIDFLEKNNGEKKFNFYIKKQ